MNPQQAAEAGRSDGVITRTRYLAYREQPGVVTLAADGPLLTLLDSSGVAALDAYLEGFRQAMGPEYEVRVVSP